MIAALIIICASVAIIFTLFLLYKIVSTDVSLGDISKPTSQYECKDASESALLLIKKAIDNSRNYSLVDESKDWIEVKFAPCQPSHNKHPAYLGLATYAKK